MKSPRASRLSILINLASSCLVGANWDYVQNGANWDNLGQCAIFAQQSPIDIPAVAEVFEKQKVFLKYPQVSSVLPLYHNGHAIALTLPDSYKGGFGVSEELKTLRSVAGNAYKLWQVNFHSPSEHTLNGKRFPLEMQLMHQRVTGGEPETAVVVVLFEDAANTYNSFLSHLMIKGLPSKPLDETKVPAGLDFAEVVGGSPFYRYTGSLTVPPCEAGVKYFVRQEPISTAHSQLRAFSKILTETCPPNGNFRTAAPSLSGHLILMPSVNLAKSPDVTVMPKNGGVAKAMARSKRDDDWQKHLKGCTPEEFDEMWNNLDRIRVGETDAFAKAKIKFQRAKREYQAQETVYGAAEMKLKTAEMLYESAPGPVDAIHLKWALVNAQKEFDDAKARLGQISKYYPIRSEKKLADAATVHCKILQKRREAKAQKELEEKRRSARNYKPPPIPKYEYSDPAVILPRGLSMSPFSLKAADGEQGSSTAPARIAENLHQPDVPPGALTKGAERHDPSIKKLAEVDVVFRVDLPISSKNISDVDTFKKDVVKALAESGKITSSRLEVKDIEGHEVPKVHGTSSLAQQAFAVQAGRNHRFLDSSNVLR